MIDFEEWYEDSNIEYDGEFYFKYSSKLAAMFRAFEAGQRSAQAEIERKDEAIIAAISMMDAGLYSSARAHLEDVIKSEEK